MPTRFVNGFKFVVLPIRFQPSYEKETGNTFGRGAALPDGELYETSIEDCGDSEMDRRGGSWFSYGFDGCSTGRGGSRVVRGM
jgi:hypothetical protein